MSTVVAFVGVVGGVLLHGGHPTSASSGTSFHWSYAVASIAFVGAVGGLLYWYYGHRAAAE